MSVSNVQYRNKILCYVNIHCLESRAEHVLQLHRRTFWTFWLIWWSIFSHKHEDYDYFILPTARRRFPSVPPGPHPVWTWFELMYLCQIIDFGNIKLAKYPMMCIECRTVLKERYATLYFGGSLDFRTPGSEWTRILDPCRLDASPNHVPSSENYCFVMRSALPQPVPHSRDHILTTSAHCYTACLLVGTINMLGDLLPRERDLNQV